MLFVAAVVGRVSNRLRELVSREFDAHPDAGADTHAFQTAYAN